MIYLIYLLVVALYLLMALPAAMFITDSYTLSELRRKRKLFVVFLFWPLIMCVIGVLVIETGAHHIRDKRVSIKFGNINLN